MDIIKVLGTRTLAWSVAGALAIGGAAAWTAQTVSVIHSQQHVAALQHEVASDKVTLAKYKSQLATTKKNLETAESYGDTCSGEALDWNKAYVQLSTMVGNLDFSDSSVQQLAALTDAAYADNCLVPDDGGTGS